MDGNNQFTAKALRLASEEADKLRDEGKCFKCKKSGHHARVCEEVVDTTLTSWDMDIVVPDVAKHFYLRELDTEAFVTLNVGKVAAPFVVLKSILCIRSDYFRAMFEGGFEEEQSRTTRLPDIEPEHFALILHWFYTGQVVFSDNSNFIGVADDKTFNEAVQMFLFADQYNTKALRRVIFNIFAETHFQYGLEPIPIARALSQLPESSGLYRLFADLIIYGWTPLNKEEGFEAALCLPAAVIGRFFVEGLEHLRWRGKKAPYDKNMCQYHEHFSDSQRVKCAEAMAMKASSLKTQAEVHEKLSKRKDV